MIARRLKIAVIGAGLTGLNSARHGINFDCDVTVFEQTDKLGGTWNYSDRTGKNEYGLDIHSSMYKGLRTNLPKEVMCFPDFPFPIQDESFLTSSEILSYINSYADKFDLRKLIRFEHHVVRVHPSKSDGNWEIIIRNLPLDKCEICYFDAVFICNGHYSVPFIPKIEGSQVFNGKQLHVHNYRDSGLYKNEKVLIIGHGPSGLDMTVELSKVADRVTLSHRSEKPITNKFNSNVDLKPEVRNLTKSGAVFIDGTEESYTVVMFCTGYKYCFPFLSPDCNITCERNFVRPLYKHCININHPTMAFIGIPHYECPAQMCDLQNRFYYTFLTGRKPMPTKKEMLEDMELEMQKQWDRGLKIHRAHFLGLKQDEYYTELARLADIEPIKPVITKLQTSIIENFHQNFTEFRKDRYRLVDDENYIKL